MGAFLIYVTGLVQGVGFRPFVHRIAVRSGVRGYVRNLGGSEVEIFVEGDLNSIREFFRLFWTERPKVMVVNRIRVLRAEERGLECFTILKSGSEVRSRSMIPPDFSICDECLREVLDVGDDRRYRYPFNSCAYCGPRYSMMYTTPWDRENTAMRDFPLCKHCIAEYTNINDVRRYHAEGISCSYCGPKVFLLDDRGKIVDVRDPIEEAAKLINEGYIVAVKGVGGFHIACLASDDYVVLKLRARKRRPEKPFAVMALDVSVASRLVQLDDRSV